MDPLNHSKPSHQQKPPQHPPKYSHPEISLCFKTQKFLILSWTKTIFFLLLFQNLIKTQKSFHNLVQETLSSSLMDSTPPYHQNRSEPRSRTKSASRLAQTEELPHLSIGLIESSSKKTLSLKSPSSLPIQELLLLSPSPLRRSKTRIADKLDMAEEAVEQVGSRRRCKSRTSQLGLLGCASPRNVRRSRRRSELEVREEKELALVEEMGKPRKRRHSTRPKKEKLSLVPSVPSSSLSPSKSQIFCFFH